MVWTTKFIFFLLLTSFTGSLLYGIWYFIGKLMERIGFVNINYILLHVCLIFWFIPFAGVFLYLGEFPQYLWGGFQLLNTPVLQYVCAVFSFIWIMIVCFLFLRYIRDLVYIKQKYKNPIPCDRKLNQFFLQICMELGLSGKKIRFALDQNDGEPKIIGVFHPIILIPLDQMEEQELRVVLYHELIHYKQKDVWLKHLIYVAKVLYWFNPIIYIMDKQVQKWGEYACDYEVIRYMDGNMKTYFEILIKLLSKNTQQNYSVLVTHMAKGQMDLYDRVKKMKGNYKYMKKKKSKMAVMLVVSLMVILSTSSVYASTMLAGEGYMAAYNATVIQEEDGIISTITTDGVIEYEVSGLEEGVVEERGDVFDLDVEDYFGIDAEMMRSDAKSFAWAIRKNGATRSLMFHKNAGETIIITAEAIPSDATFRVGIVEPDGTRRYVSATDFVSHRFQLDQTGNYCIYVQNMSEGEIEVRGTFMY